MRSLRASVDALDNCAHTVTRGVVLRPGLVPAREQGLDATRFDDEIPIFEALDGSGHHLAKPLAVLRINVLSFGLADLLKDHLLGRLGRDAAEHIGGLGKLDLHVHLSLVAVEPAGLVQGDLGLWVRDLLHDLPNGEQLDLSSFAVELGPEVFVGLVVLA